MSEVTCYVLSVEWVVKLVSIHATTAWPRHASLLAIQSSLIDEHGFASSHYRAIPEVGRLVIRLVQSEVWPLLTYRAEDCTVVADRHSHIWILLLVYVCIWRQQYCRWREGLCRHIGATTV